MFEKEGERFAAEIEMFYRKGKFDGKEYILSRLRKIKFAYDKADKTIGIGGKRNDLDLAS